jgi:hypothetical protein
MSYFDCDETDRAARMYFEHAEQLGQTVDQPCRHDSGMQADGQTIVFRAGRRVLGRYRVQPGGSIRRLRPEVLVG